MRVFYAQAVYGREEIEAVTKVLEDSSLTLMGGPQVDLFEHRVLHHLLLEDLLELESRNLEKLERLLQLGRHDQTLVQPHPDGVFHFHS